MRKRKAERWIIIPDCHVPFEDSRAFNLVANIAKECKVDGLAILGDFLDLFSVSFHDKDPRRVSQLSDELNAANKRLTQLDKIGAKKKLFVEGNHEYRLTRYLINKAPALLETVSVPQMLSLKERGWKFTPYRKAARLGKLHLTHDVGYAGKIAHMQSGAAFEHSVVIGHCLPVNYEVLTRNRGFVKLSEVLYTDTVLCYKDGAVTTSPVLDIVNWRYTGEMACFDSNTITQRMTDRHHIYTKDGRYVPVRDAIETLTKADLVVQASPLPGNDYPVSDDMLRLVVAYCADGHRASEGSIRFHLKKARKIERLTQLLSSVGASVAWSEPGKTGAVKTKQLSRGVQLDLIRLAPDKCLPQWLTQLSARQRQIVLDELPLWDGSSIRHGDKDYGCKQFCSHKPAELDLVQLLLSMHGIRSRSHGNIISYNIDVPAPDCRRKLKEFVRWEAVENLEVGCITTEHQNFFVRTPEGRIELSGNTHRVGVHYFGNVLGESHVAAMLGWLGDAEATDYMHEVKAKRDWHLGFGTAQIEPDGTAHLQAVPIIKYRACAFGQIFT